jgi:DNA-binding response OmpR family regulator
MRILVAEDDPVARRLVQRVLQDFGHVADVVEDGLEAWRRLEDADYDVLISDWLMPGLDGLGLTRRLREREGRPFCYVLLLTARFSKEDIVAATLAGADDFMVKPFDRELLHARLHAAERVVRLERDLAARVQELEEVAEEAEALRRRLDEIEKEGRSR